jgi:3-methylcrotonyl-CoA carboxylase alpha subunit
VHGGARRHFDIQHAGALHAVARARPHSGASDSRLDLQIGTQRWPLQATALGGGRHDVTLADRRLHLTVYAHGERVAVFAPEHSAVLQQIDAIAHAGEGAAEGGQLTAPMPGKVIAFMAKVGDTVARGQALAVMEAMKMEHTLHAPRDGVVAELLYAVGDQVGEGGELLRLAPA